MADDEPMTRRECELIHKWVEDAITSLGGKVDHWGRQHDDNQKEMNGAVAENTKFRIESTVVYRALAFGWATLVIPLIAIAVAMIR